MVDFDAAVAAVQDPNADPVFLAKIAYENPEFGANVAVNPRCYPGLKRWIAEFGDDRARETLAKIIGEDKFRRFVRDGFAPEQAARSTNATASTTESAKPGLLCRLKARSITLPGGSIWCAVTPASRRYTASKPW